VSGRAVYIEWLDHNDLSDENAWVKIDELDPAPSKVRSLGFVVKETAESLVIAHSIGGDGECAGPFCVVKRAAVLVRTIPQSALKEKK